MGLKDVITKQTWDDIYSSILHRIVPLLIRFKCISYLSQKSKVARATTQVLL